MLHGYIYFYSLHKKEEIYVDIAEDIETRFDTSSYELERSLYREKNKKVIGSTKDELDKKIMTKFGTLRRKVCSH